MPFLVPVKPTIIAFALPSVYALPSTRSTCVQAEGDPMDNQYIPTHYIDFLSGEVKTPRMWKAHLNTHTVTPYAGIGRLIFHKKEPYLVLNQACLEHLEAAIQAKTGGSTFAECRFPLRSSKISAKWSAVDSTLILKSTDNYVLTSELLQFRSTYISHLCSMVSLKNSGKEFAEKEEPLENSIDDPITPPETEKEIDYVISCLESPSAELVRLASLFVARAGPEILEFIVSKKNSYYRQIDEMTKKIARLDKSISKIKQLSTSNE
jgi:hypothetical protein